MNQEEKDALNAIITTIENKVRHVRTAAGSRKYNEPIGAPIIVHVTPSVPTQLPHVDIQASVPSIDSQVHTDINKKLEELGKTKPKTRKKPAKDSYDIPSFEIKKGFEQNENTGVKEPIFTSTDKKTGRTVVYRKKYREAYETYKGSTKKTPIDIDNLISGAMYNDSNIEFTMERIMKQPYIDAAYEDSQSRKPFGLHYSDGDDGLYGVDWLREDDGDFIDPKNEKERISAIEREQKDLGIVIRQYSPGSPEFISYQSQELINRHARVMDNLFPGVNSYQPIYAIDNVTGKDAIAYNTLMQKRRNNYVNSGQTHHANDKTFADDSITWDYCGIGLKSNYFGNEVSTFSIYSLYNQRPGWHSITPDRHYDGKNMQPTDKMLTAVIAHETGHTIYRMIEGELEADANPEFHGYLSEFHAKIVPILKKYGFMPENSIDTDSDSIDFNADYNMKLLSRYSAKSLHEFFAENWAEYFFAESPRPLANEIGQVMQEFLEKFLLAEGHEAL